MLGCAMTSAGTSGTDQPVISAGRLARIGVQSPAASDHLRTLDLHGDDLDRVLAQIAAAADPDAALLGLAGLVAAADRRRIPVRSALTEDAGLLCRLAAVCGSSLALGDHLAAHPDQWQDLCTGASPPQVLTADPQAAEDPDALRVAYRRRLLGIAAADLTGVSTVDEVAAALSDLADATLEVALRQAASRLPEQANRCRLAVVALGKCGGGELNYVSDVDVVFVHEPAADSSDEAAARAASRLAAELMRICTDHTAAGTIWPVDAGLRPEGRSGPLSRTLAGHLGYYERWADSWEFQALLKARPAAGDADLGRSYAEAVAVLVWRAGERPGFVPEVQAMRRKVVEHIPSGEAGRALKLGPGGLRDVEFAVQLLQLVHGRSDERLRVASTLVALDALTAGGYVGRDDGAALAQAYRFLRTMEHRLQLWQLRRTHVLPDDDETVRRLGRAMGHRTKPLMGLRSQWQECIREVRRLHEKLFYRPLLEAVAALPAGELRLSTKAALQRLTALGYEDPRGALIHLEALTSGLRRRAAIQRQLLPAMLGWFADGPDPDAALLAFRRVSERLGGTYWYLQRLRDEGEAAEHLARVLNGSRLATDLLLGTPEAVALLGDSDGLRPRAPSVLATEMAAAAKRHTDPAAAIEAVRTMRHRELCRIALAEVLGQLAGDEVGEALTQVTIATITGALTAASAAVQVEQTAPDEPLPVRLAVVSMGRLGGHELGFASDADVMFVYVPMAGTAERAAGAAAHAVAQQMRSMLARPGGAPPLELDAGLRPEGRQGPLVRSLASYAAYYDRWSQPWEAQALLRAEAVIGDPEVSARFTALIDPLRWPADGLDERAVTEVRRIKSRVEAERLPRGADPAAQLKLGPGGLADVEWTAQLLQMRHAGAVPGLRTTRTVPALLAAVSAGLLASEDADDLIDAWRLAQRLRNAVMQVRGRPADSLPTNLRDRAGVAYLLGWSPLDSERLSDEWRRAARRARAVVERVFWS